MNSIYKGKIGEDFVSNVAYKTFLKYWCYPAPLDIIRDNKEICDLLIVFKSICIIVSVKNYSFDGNYERYFRKTVDNAIRQVKGAERRLFRNDIPVLLKHPDRDAELFEKDKIKRIYRIIVNLNDNIKYYQTSYFVDGKIYSVMDSIAWEAAISELTSIADVTNYLAARCELFSEFPAFILPRSEYDFAVNDEINATNDLTNAAQNNDELTIVLGSELDLIAEYYFHGFKFPDEIQHRNKDIKAYFIKLDGRWKKFKDSGISEMKDEYEKEGYFIDMLTTQFLLNTKHGNHLAEMFFQLDRLERSGFVSAFMNYHQNILAKNDGSKLNRTHIVLPYMHMVFLCFDDDFPKEELETILDISLQHHHYLFDFTCEEVGALGMSKRNGEFLFGYSRITESYTDDEIQILKDGFKGLGWKIDKINRSDIEFPD